MMKLSVHTVSVPGAYGPRRAHVGDTVEIPWCPYDDGCSNQPGRYRLVRLIHTGCPASCAVWDVVPAAEADMSTPEGRDALFEGEEWPAVATTVLHRGEQALPGVRGVECRDEACRWCG